MSDELSVFRKAIDNALSDEVISQEEAGFIVTLAARFREDIERKSKAMIALQGEIAQLKANEKIILDIVSNMVAAQRRAEDRDRTLRELKESGTARKGMAVIEDESNTIEENKNN